MNKNFIILIIVAVSVVVIIIIGNSQYKSSSNKTFGNSTLKLIKNEDYRLSCNDSKMLSKMLVALQKDYAEYPELMGETSNDNMTPAMKEFQSSMNYLNDQIELTYKDNIIIMDNAQAGIGEGVQNVFQVSIMSNLDMISIDDLDEYLNIVFCGKQVSEGWVSPLDIGY